jgi:hypothetical protein
MVNQGLFSQLSKKFETYALIQEQFRYNTKFIQNLIPKSINSPFTTFVPIQGEFSPLGKMSNHYQHVLIMMN